MRIPFLNRQTKHRRSSAQLQRIMHRIFIAILILLSLLVIGTVGFYIIPQQPNFSDALYMTIITITTVGYGDIHPHTVLGQGLAAVVMVMGYGIIAVPTGIFAAELGQVMGQKKPQSKMCPQCGITSHYTDAVYCRVCGSDLNPPDTENPPDNPPGSQ